MRSAGLGRAAGLGDYVKLEGIKFVGDLLEGLEA